MPKYNNSALRAKIRNELITKHGCECMQCHTTQSKSGKRFDRMSEKELAKYLILHEIDSKKDLTKNNIRLLCKKCNQEPNRLLNAIKNGKKPLEDKHIYMHRLKESYKYDSYSMYKHVKGYKPFFLWLDKQLKDNQFMTFEYILRNGASMNIGGCSEKTIKRWLLPEISDTGKYTTIKLLGKEYVILKSDLPKFQKQKEHEKNLEEKYNE